jgi:hypothetical protein
MKFPANNLAQCINKLKKAKSITSLEDFSIHMGYTTFNNGAAKSLVYSLFHFGLIEFSGKMDQIKMTPLADKILNSFTTEYEDAVFEAAFKPELFDKLNRQFGIEIIDKSIIQEFCTNLKMTESASRKAALSYSNTVQYLFCCCPDLNFLKRASKNMFEKGRVTLSYPPNMNREEIVNIVHEFLKDHIA